jgi:hypothetical protein
MKSKWNDNKISFIALSIIMGYLVGELIKYINILGSSEKAPMVCAMGASAYAIFIKYYKNSKPSKKQL